MKRIIILNGREIEYEFTRKKVKNINLRIRSDGSISVSAGQKVPIEYVEKFLSSKAAYIIGAIDKYGEREESIPKPTEYADGEKLVLFGKTLTVKVEIGKKDKAVLIGDELLISVKDPESVDKRRAIAEKYIKNVCRETISAMCDEIHPEFELLGVTKPLLRFRSMKTRWGVCRPTRNELTFSYMLAAEPIERVRYVVYHEFVHFLHPNHSKDFYNTLSKFVPDWKSLKKAMGSGNAER